MNKILIQRIASLQLQGKNGYEQDYLKIMAGDKQLIEQWSAPPTKQERQDRNNAIFDHWLAGETTTELAEKAKLAVSVVWEIVQFIALSRLASAEITEQPPIYNVWNFSTCDPRFGQNHPGRIPGQAIINLLLWLTKPFDVVCDPMAGGGTTIDVCRYLLRRYYCYDIDPRRTDIKKRDIYKEGYPQFPHKPNLIILDPPYWRLKRDEYSSDGAANTPYSDWLNFISKLAKGSLSCLQHSGYVALFAQSFLDEWESQRYIFSNWDCFNIFSKTRLRRDTFAPVIDISLNIPSQVKSFRDVTWAKKNNKLLSLKRDIFIFQKRELTNAIARL